MAHTNTAHAPEAAATCGFHCRIGDTVEAEPEVAEVAQEVHGRLQRGKTRLSMPSKTGT